MNGMCNTMAAAIMLFVVVMPVRGDSYQELRPCLSSVISGDVELNEKNTGEILQQLLNYPVNLPELISDDESEVVRGVRLLCDFRETMHAQGYNYNNLLVSQLVDRIASVSLMQYIISSGSVSPEIEMQCKRVTDFQYNPKSLESVFDSSTKPSLEEVQVRLIEMKPPEMQGFDLAEFSKSQLDMFEKTKLFYRLLMIATNCETCENAVMEKGNFSDWNDMFKEKCVVSLLNSLYLTDHLVHKQLPLLVLYVKNCDCFGVEDDWGKIKAVFDLSKHESVLTDSYLNNDSSGSIVLGTLQHVKEAKLYEFAGLNAAHKLINPQPSELFMINDSLFVIESAKSGILKLLKDDDVVTLNDVEEFSGRKLFFPEGDGEYQVGGIGIPARYIYPDGRVIYGKVIERLSEESFQKRQEEEQAKLIKEVNEDIKAKGGSVTIIPE